MLEIGEIKQPESGLYLIWGIQILMNDYECL